MTHTLKKWIAWILWTAVAAVSGWLIWRGLDPPYRVPQGRQEVIFWHFWGGPDLAVVRDVVDRFNQSQTRYWVREVAMPGNNLRAKLFLSAAGGTPPDLLNIDDPVLADWYQLGLIRSVEDLAGAELAERISNWMLPPARQLSTCDQTLVGLCNGLDLRALYFNRTGLERAGFAEPRSLEELVSICRGLESADKLHWEGPFAFLPNPQRILFYGYLFGGNVWDPVGQHTTLADPQLVRALEWIQSFTHWHGADRLAAHRQAEQSLPGKTFPLLPSGEGLFGRYLLVLDGQWRTREIGEFVRVRLEQGRPVPEFGVCPMPPPAGNQPGGGWANGNVFVFPSRGRQGAGALEFAKFWIGFENSETGARTTTAGGWIPVSQTVIDDPLFVKYVETNPLFLTFVRLAAETAQRSTPVIPGASYLTRMLEQAAERAALDPRQDPRAALEEANREVQRQLDRQGRSRRMP